MSRRDVSHAQDGFALLALLAVIGVAGVGVLLVVQAFVPTLRDRATVATTNLEVAARAARHAFRQHGALPNDLDALAASARLDDDGSWRRDPYGAGQDIELVATAYGLRLSSRGPDGRSGTADDLVADVLGQPLLRARQRTRLRLLRAALARSRFRDAPTMTTADRQAVVAAMREHAVARRRWWSAGADERSALQARMHSAEQALAALAAAHDLPDLPPSLVGAGGLMSELGMPDGRAVDGRGIRLLRDPVTGFVAAGWDATGGTDDDM